jgi:flagellar L-ring protein FlgH
MPPTDIPHPMTVRPPERPVTSRPSNGSIFHDQASMSSLFEDSRPRHVGDILTVQISENINATRNLNTTAERKTGQTTAVTALSPLAKLANALGANSILEPSVTSNSDSSLQGQGKMNASDVFTGTITVTVSDVYPNGNLVISGEKLMSLGGNREYLRLSGIVNPATISSTNTVLSTQIADARIEYKGTGTLHDVQDMGWLQKFFLSVSPF